MKRYLLTLLLLALAAFLFSLFPQQFLNASSVAGQRQGPRKAPTPTTAKKAGVDYAHFSHATKQHQEECATCHKVPTSNWQPVRGFPDVADYPGHDACVRCHRQQFFKSAQPVICTDCHTKVSPREKVRFAFRNPDRPRQFTIEFPHDKHQDVIALLRREATPSPVFDFAKRSLVAFAHVAQAADQPPADQPPADQPPADQPKKNYNNCTICHAPNTKERSAPAGGWVNRFTPSTESFKSVPEAHSSCFNCHWSGQKPTRVDCAGCHTLASPYLPVAAPERKSMKFKHSREQHVAECTTCHINITKSASLRGLKPDVPITQCTECHNKQGLRTDLNKELEAIDANKEFVCTYCHTSDFGRRDPPPGHYIVAERPPITRKDLK